METKEEEKVSQSLQSWDTKLFADCVEGCYNEGYENIVACATYQLEEEKGTRAGGITLIEVR